MKELLRSLHSCIFWTAIFSCSVIIHTGSYITALFIKDEDGKALLYRKTAKLWGSLILNFSLVKVKISGLDNIPLDTNVIFTPNHQSFIDIFILLKYLPGSYRFVIMRSLFKIPVMGYHITKAGFVSLDRKDRKSSVKTIGRIVDLLKNNESFVIFPEGKLTPDGNVGEFGRGASIIIQSAGRPVVPIAIDGTFDVLPKGAWKLRPREVSVKIGKPVYFKEYHGEVTRETSRELGSELRGIIVGLKG